MTTITINRAIVEQALEALGLAKLNGKPSLHPAEIGEIADAITALRAALAQQAEPEEPVAWMIYTLDGKSVCVTDNPAGFGEGHRALPLYTAPPQRTMVPLTEEEIERIARDCLDAWSCTRAVEAAHGIKAVE